MIDLREVEKSYPAGSGEIHVLKSVSLTLEAGTFTVIMGPSGSGKSSLLHCLGLLDRDYRGEYRLEGASTRHLSDEEISRLRNRRIGFIFQAFHLFPQLTALENVMVPLEYAGVPRRDRELRAFQQLERVGLARRVDHFPSALSGGEQQRVAIARALVNHPPLILADEPTGNLDQRSAEEVMVQLHDLHRGGQTVVMITHNPEWAEGADAVYLMQDGRLKPRNG